MRALVVFCLTLPIAAIGVCPVHAQQGAPIGAPITNLGTPVTSLNPSPSSGDDNSPVGQSFVANIDSSVPRDMVRLRLDLGYHIPRPTRAEYFQAKGGLPFSPGMPLPEPNINSAQELSAYAEFAPLSFFSVFIETPMRWINPEVNANIHGYGDVNFGFKVCTWNSQDFVATIQLRFSDPTAEHPGLGTNHWTIEPAMLIMWRPYDNIIVEGDFRYAAPLGGTDFAGDVLRYGVGVSLGSAGPSLWFKPVAEAVGWTVVGGKQLVVTSPESMFVQNTSGQTIVNGYLGMRLGLGSQFDCYAGYGRCFTGTSWSRDFVRVEFRLFY